jgi:hypothetical protein
MKPAGALNNKHGDEKEDSPCPMVLKDVHGCRGLYRNRNTALSAFRAAGISWQVRGGDELCRCAARGLIGQSDK